MRGQSLIKRHLRATCQAGIREVVINLGWLGAQIQDRIGEGDAYGLRVRNSNEGDNILGSAVALTDDFAGHLVLVKTPDYRSQGDFDLVDGRVRNSRHP